MIQSNQHSFCPFYDSYMKCVWPGRLLQSDRLKALPTGPANTLHSIILGAGFESYSNHTSTKSLPSRWKKILCSENIIILRHIKCDVAIPLDQWAQPWYEWQVRSPQGQTQGFTFVFNTVNVWIPFYYFYPVPQWVIPRPRSLWLVICPTSLVLPTIVLELLWSEWISGTDLSKVQFNRPSMTSQWFRRFSFSLFFLVRSPYLFHRFLPFESYPGLKFARVVGRVHNVPTSSSFTFYLACMRCAFNQLIGSSPPGFKPLSFVNLHLHPVTNIYCWILSWSCFGLGQLHLFRQNCLVRLVNAVKYSSRLTCLLETSTPSPFLTKHFLHI